MASVSLIIKFKNNSKPIAIPFKNLEKLDQFTKGYIDAKELLSELDKTFNIGLTHYVFDRIYIAYEYKNRHGEYAIDYLPVAYMEDDFDIDHLKMMYAKYYKDDYLRIILTPNGIRYVRNERIQNFCNGYGEITDVDIDLAVKSFLDGSYKKNRDAYFILKKNGYRVKKNRFSVESKLDRTDLSKFEIKDEYMASLGRYAMQGVEEHARVMDELAGYDMDEVRHMVVNANYGLFDGEGVSNRATNLRRLKNNLLSLESLSGMSMNELFALIDKYRQEYEDENNGRRRK